MFVIEFVHIQRSKLFEGLESVVLSVIVATVHYKEPLKSIWFDLIWFDRYNFVLVALLLEQET